MQVLNTAELLKDMGRRQNIFCKPQHELSADSAWGNMKLSGLTTSESEEEDTFSKDLVGALSQQQTVKDSSLSVSSMPICHFPDHVTFSM